MVKNQLNAYTPFNISGFVHCKASMSGNQVNCQEIWPESSQTFGFVRARKRHTVIMEGFLERASGETNAGKKHLKGHL